MEKDTLLKQLTVLDFMSLDLQLFLNTHPTDAEALHMYNDTIASAKKARAQYEAVNGPLTSFRCPAENGWQWSKCPWPWQEAFNIKIFPCGEERL